MERERVEISVLPLHRACLLALIRKDGDDYAGLARMIGRPASYLSRHVRKGAPPRLRSEEARTLARYFGVDPDIIGGDLPMAHTSPLDDRYQETSAQPKTRTFAEWLIAQKHRTDPIGRLAEAAAADRGFPRAGSLKQVWQRINQLGADDEMIAAMEDAELDFSSY